MNNKTINYQAHKAASADLCHDLSICKRMFTKQSKLLRSFVNCIGFTVYETVDGIEDHDYLCKPLKFTIKSNK